MSTITTIAASDLITNSRADINTNFSNLNSDKIETSTLDTDTALTANSDSKIATQKAVKTYVDAGGNVNASETSKGIVEEATDAEVTAGTATGATGAKLFVTPTKLATRLSSLAIDYQAFTASGTWTKPTLPATSPVLVRVWGGGGSGGSRTSAGGATGGGGGGFTEKWFVLSDLGTTETVTIAAAAAGVSGNTDGNTGGNCTFGASGTLVTGYGGGAGDNEGTPSEAGGGGGGGPLGAGADGEQNAAGAAGSPGTPIAGTGGITSGPGGTALYGGGGGGCNAAGGSSYHGGGGGGGSTASTGSGAGGTSVQGGAGGAGSHAGSGTAGTAPSGGGGASITGTSGAGAVGRVIVTVFT